MGRLSMDEMSSSKLDLDEHHRHAMGEGNYGSTPRREKEDHLEPRLVKKLDVEFQTQQNN